MFTSFFKKNKCNKIRTLSDLKTLKNLNPLPKSGYMGKLPRDRSKYFTQLEQYRKVWPRKKITLLDFSELKRDSNGLLRRICGELDIPFKPLEFRKKFVHKTVIPTRAQAIAYRYPTLRKTVNMLPASVRRTLNRLPVLNKREKVVLSPGQKDELRDLLAEDMRRLKQSYGFPVGNWGF